MCFFFHSVLLWCKIKKKKDCSVPLWSFNVLAGASCKLCTVSRQNDSDETVYNLQLTSAGLEVERPQQSTTFFFFHYCLGSNKHILGPSYCTRLKKFTIIYLVLGDFQPPYTEPVALFMKCPTRDGAHALIWTLDLTHCHVLHASIARARPCGKTCSSKPFLLAKVMYQSPKCWPM